MLKMKIEDLFKISGKTIFTGVLDTNLVNIKDIPVSLLLDGKEVSRIIINGEVKNGTPYRDLWTKDDVKISKEDVLKSVVFLQNIDE